MQRVAVVGAGRMGVPIAATLALAGLTVDLVDLKVRAEAEWSAFKAQVETAWQQAVAPFESLPAPPLHQGAGPWLREADLLVEALPERLAVKQEAYALLQGSLRPDCLVTSTTSSFAPDELSTALADPSRFLVAHWLHPPTLMPLVEVAPCQETSPESLSQVTALLERAGKVPVHLRGRPGLVVARLQVLIMNEAAKLVAEGIAPAAEIDRAVRLGLGFRFLVQGLLAFADTGGIDVLYYVLRHLEQALGDPKYAPSAAVARLVAAGELGQKTGRGFYDWGDESVQAERAAALERYLRLLDFLELGRPGRPT